MPAVAGVGKRAKDEAEDVDFALPSDYDEDYVPALLTMPPNERVNEPMLAAALSLHQETCKWSSKVVQLSSPPASASAPPRTRVGFPSPLNPLAGRPYFLE